MTTTASPTRTITQTLTDRAHLEPHGPVTYLRFDWADGRDVARDYPSRDRFVATVELEQLLDQLVGEQLGQDAAKTLAVTKLRGLAGLAILSDEGLSIFDQRSYEGFLPYTELSLDDGEARELFDDDLARRAYFFDGYDGSWTALGSDRPANRVFLIDFITGASARYFELDGLRPLLEAHPWVVSVARDEGRPGSYDHVPAGLVVEVKLPDDIYEALDQDEARCRDRSPRVGRARVGLPAVTATDIADALFHAPLYDDGPAPLGTDPLGIVSTIRRGDYPGDFDHDF